MRTYPKAHWQIAANSGTQGVFPATDSTDDYTFPTKSWASLVTRKMQQDMMVPSGNTPGDGLYVETTAVTNALSGENYLRTGISLLSQRRSYQFMNTQNSVAFLEVYEYVFKGNKHDQNYNSANDQQAVIPTDLWALDMNSDNPDWNTAVTWIGDKNISITAPGARPTKYSKALNSYWRLEKKTKYIMPAGNSCTHTVNIPAMYLSPEEMTPFVANDRDGNHRAANFIPGKTRSLLFICHGQLGFEGEVVPENPTAAQLQYGNRLEHLPCSINVKYRQLTKLRLTEHGQKKYIHYTGCHDLTSDVAEHSALIKPTLLVEDPVDKIDITDQDL